MHWHRSAVQQAIGGHKSECSRLRCSVKKLAPSETVNRLAKRISWEANGVTRTHPLIKSYAVFVRPLCALPFASLPFPFISPPFPDVLVLKRLISNRPRRVEYSTFKWYGTPFIHGRTILIFWGPSFFYGNRNASVSVCSNLFGREAPRGCIYVCTRAARFLFLLSFPVAQAGT